MGKEKGFNTDMHAEILDRVAFLQKGQYTEDMYEIRLRYGIKEGMLLKYKSKCENLFGGIVKGIRLRVVIALLPHGVKPFFGFYDIRSDRRYVCALDTNDLEALEIANE